VRSKKVSEIFECIQTFVAEWMRSQCGVRL
jgi:hypothetical protein